MADETENKPKFILNKQKNEPQTQHHATPTQPSNGSEVVEKKKVVVIKKKVVVATQPTAAAPSTPREKPVVKVVATATPPVKKEPEMPQQTVVKAPEKSAPPIKETPKAPAPKAPVSEVKQDKPEVKTVPGKTTFELSPPRPNIKQGNLAEKRRPPYPRKDGAQGQRPPRREGGFTGAQAREGYQNRSERDARQNNGGQGGYQGNRTGGYQGGQGGYQGGQGGQGGYQGNRTGGYQGGQGGQGNQGGYQGNRTGGYQGGRPGGYQQRPGGFGGNRPAGGGRPGGFGGNRPAGGGRPGGFGGNRPGGFGGNSPAPIGEAKKVPAKKTFTKKKTVYSRKKQEEDFIEDKLYNQKKKQSAMSSPVPTQIDIMETISVSDLAKKMNLKASEIIAKLMTMGMMVSITQSIDADTAILLASEYGCEVHIISLYDETVIESEADVAEEMLSRPPVVTIMGHVDHGKTKTLDAIRSSNVVATEFGGITQHIGAYMVDTPKGSITFLDTPGHEAFTMMRARGAQITDIVVLVVAADDGVMPQTIEAINHAKDAKVPIIVAVNKIDKPEANPDRVKTQLSELGLTPEEWGGETQYVHISALRKEGIDDLLDAILLQAELLELKASWNCRAEGKVIESRVDHGRGVVSSVIIERGTLHTGDPYVAGIYAGRVRAIFNDRGQKIQEATPSMPVEILGVESMPMAGDPFQVTDSEKTARAISSKRQELKRFEDAKNVKKVTLDNLYATIDAGEIMELKVIIKADLQGSAEALKQSLEKLSTKDIRLVVIHSSAGAINESDVSLAAADSNAIIIGFNVRPTPKAKVLAEQEKVDIRKYNIIYKAVEEITAAMEGMLKPDVKEEVIGTVEVRDTFKVPKIGVIAGSYVLDGIIKRSSSVNIIRDGIVIHTGKISSLKRFKDDAKEVAAGFECGIGIDDWHDINVGDQFEVFELVEVARKLGDKLSDEKSDKTDKATDGKDKPSEAK